MTNGILHWGHRSHTDTTPADRRGRYTSCPSSSGYVAHVHAILK